MPNWKKVIVSGSDASLSSLSLSNLGSQNEILLVGANNQVSSSNLLSIDTTNNRVGIGTSSPEVKLHIDGDAAQEAQIRLEQHNNTADAPDIRIRRSRGTHDTPATLVANDYMFRLNVDVYDGSSYTNAGQLRWDNDGTTDNNGTNNVFGLQTRVNGTTADRLTIDKNGNATFSGAVTGSNLLVNSEITSVSASIDYLAVNDKLQGNGSGFQFFAYNEDTVKVKFANWYSSNDRQYGMGQLWYETWFAAIDNGALRDNRRIGFYLEEPSHGASDANGGTGQHPNNARFYVDINGGYLSGSLDVSGAVTASALQAAGLTYPTSDGTSEQVLQTDGAGNLTFADLPSEDVTTTVKNVAGVTLSKGTPVHAVSSSSSGNVVPVIAASASDATTMPATFILGEELADDAEGSGIAVGAIKGVDTSAFTVGDVVYVGESGGYTNVKPTGSANLIQNLGVVTKVHASNGSGFIYGSGRSNDVPNLPTGKIWVGSDNYSATSSFVHLDESNGRLGIGTSSPQYPLHIKGGSNHLFTVRDINTETRVGIGTTNPGYAIHIGDYSNKIIQGMDSLRFGAGTERISSTGNRIYLNAEKGYFFYPTGSTPSYDNYGVEFRHLRDSAANTNDNILLVEKSDGSDVFNVKSSGNVGIGTSSPSYKLHVNGTSRIEGRITLANNVNNYIDVTNGVLNIKTNDDFRIFKGLNTGVYYKGGTDRVGIGTSTPSEKLTVEGNISASGDLDIEGDITGSNLLVNGTFKSVGIQDSADALAIFINGNEEVGIGTTSPTNKLHVSAGTGDAPARFESTDNLVRIALEDSYDVAYLGQDGQTGIAFFGYESTVNNNNLSISSSGNVGIGTTSPDFKLEVAGSTKVDYLQIKNNGYAGGLPTTPEIYSPASATLAISTGGGERFRVNNDGAKVTGDLTVTGTVTAQEFKTEFVSASVIYESGSTKFGDTQDDNHDFTGSLNLSGSAEINIGGSNNRKIYLTSTGGYPQIDADGTLYLGGNQASDVQLLDNLLPSANNSKSLGTSTRRWSNIYGAGLDVSGSISLTDGSASSPAIKFASDTNTGIYRAGGDQLSIATGGAERLRVDSNGIEIPSNGKLGTTNNAFNWIQLYRSNDASMLFRMGHSSVGRFGFLNSSNTEVFTIDARNERVGIGTTSPSYQLDVSGSGNFTNNLTATGSLIVQHTSNSSRYLRLGWGSIYANDANNELILGSDYSDSNATRISISGKNSDNTPSDAISMHANNGVAIFSGSISNYFDPQALLHVSGTGRFDADVIVSGSEANQSTKISRDGLYIARPADGTYAHYVKESGHDLKIGTRSRVYFEHNGATVTSLTLVDNGRAGVGTTSPEATLHVKSPSNFTNTGSLQVDTTAVSSTQVFMDLKGASGGDQYIFKHYRAGTQQNWMRDDQGRLQFYTKPLSGYLSSTAFGFYADSDVTGNVVSFGNFNTTHMVVSASGNVGIGTTSPSEKLTVEGNISASGDLILGNAKGIYFDGGTGPKIVEASNGMQFWANGAGSDKAINIDGNGRVTLFTHTGGGKNDLRIDLGGTSTNLVYVSGSGNVGIGTTTPGEILTIATPIATKAEIEVDSGADAIIALDKGASTRRAAVVYRTAGTDNWYVGTADSDIVGNGDDYFIGTTVGGTNAEFFISQSGNVGIGTTTPSDTLEVNGGIGIRGAANYGMRLHTIENGLEFKGITNTPKLVLEASTSTQRRLEMKVSSGGSFIGFGGTTNVGLSFYDTQASDAVRMRIDSTGNVGIGTTSPSQKLEVRDGNILASGSNSKVALGTATGIPRIYSNANEDLLLATANQSGSVVYLQDSDGRVGIGTSSPQKKLTVAGAVSASYYYGDGSNLTGITTSDGLADILSNNNEAGGNAIDMGSGNITQIGEAQAETFNGTTASLAYVTASANLHIDTNVGIKDSSPTRELTVNGDIGVKNSGRLYLWDSHDNNYLQYDKWTTSASSGMTITNQASTGNLSLQTVSSTRLFISASGNVGIGTTTPTQRLDVRGGVLIAQDTPANLHGGTLEVYRNATRANVVIHQDNGTSQARLHLRRGTVDTYIQNDADGFEIRTDSLLSGDPALRIANGGDTTIYKNLTVNGTVTAQEFKTEFVSASIIYESGSTKFGDTSDDNHAFTGSIALQVSESSKGIAVDTATGIQVGKLYNSNSNTFPVGVLALSYGSNAGSGMLTGQSNALKVRGGSSSGGKIIFTSFNDEVMRMNDTGLGIHTSSPSEALHVSGAMIIDSGSQATKLDSNRIAVSSTATVIADIDPTTYVGAVIDYTAYNDDKTTGMRTGQLMLAFDESTNVTVSDVTTTDIGDTSGVTFTATNNGSSVRLSYNTPDTSWNIRLFRRLL